MSKREPDPLGRGPALAFPREGPRRVAIIDRMTRALGAREGLRPQRFDLVLIGTALLITIATALVVADQTLRLVFVDRTLDVAVTSIATLGAAGLALLTMPRYRESGRLSLLLLTSAFVLLATYSGVTVMLVLLKLDGKCEVGMTLGCPRQLPLYVSAATQLVAAGLFMAAGVAAVRRVRTRLSRPRLRLVLPVVFILLGRAHRVPVARPAAAAHRRVGHRRAHQEPRRGQPPLGHHAAGGGAVGRGRGAPRGRGHPVPLHVRGQGPGLGWLPGRGAGLRGVR